ncbi:MAG: MFS transporter, partial [bacterium]|nr:MFS transporter [bacterium]
GYYYDRCGFVVLIVIVVISPLFAPLVFLGNFTLALCGVILWSIGVSAHQSLMRAIVAHMVAKEKRGAAYGVFNTGFGIFWFLGSFLMGYLYDISIISLVIFSLIIQLLALPLLWFIKNDVK